MSPQPSESGSTNLHNPIFKNHLRDAELEEVPETPLMTYLSSPGASMDAFHKASAWAIQQEAARKLTYGSGTAKAPPAAPAPALHVPAPLAADLPALPAASVRLSDEDMQTPRNAGLVSSYESAPDTNTLLSEAIRAMEVREREAAAAADAAGGATPGPLGAGKLHPVAEASFGFSPGGRSCDTPVSPESAAWGLVTESPVVESDGGRPLWTNAIAGTPAGGGVFAREAFTPPPAKFGGVVKPRRRARWLRWPGCATGAPESYDHMEGEVYARNPPRARTPEEEADLASLELVSLQIEDDDFESQAIVGRESLPYQATPGSLMLTPTPQGVSFTGDGRGYRGGRSTGRKDRGVLQRVDSNSMDTLAWLVSEEKSCRHTDVSLRTRYTPGYCPDT